MEELGSNELDGEMTVLISAIEHYAYCPRQCALIHLENTYDENQFTVRGQLLHERVDEGEETLVDGVRIVRGIPLWSDRLGIRGRADAVELRPEGPYPVEYKSGRRRGRHADLQLCAQALCLEEMMGAPVRHGAVFYFQTKRRVEIPIDDALRQRTAEVIDAVRRLLQEGQLPEPPNDARCPNCSLIDACLPSVVGEPARVRGFQGALFQPLAPGGEDA